MNGRWCRALIGSVKMTVDANGTPQTWNDYYPYGMTMAGRSYISGNMDGRYQFTGKERDAAETGYDYFGARYYDSWRGQWLSVDPMASKYPSWSPYNYVMNNPVIVVDPTGMDTTVYFFDQKNQPIDDYRTAQYTANVYIDEDGTVYGPYQGSTFPDSKENESTTNDNTVDEGSHDFNNTNGNHGGTKEGLNLVKDKDKTGEDNRVANGKDPNGNPVTMKDVNVHSGYNTKRYSSGCPTISPKDAGSFFSHFDWSSPRGTTGNSKGTVQIYRGTSLKSIVTQTYLKVKQWLQNY